MGRLEPKEERRARVKELYESGHTVEEICKIMRYKTQESVIYILKRLGIYETYGGIDVPKVLALREAGWHMADILTEFDHRFTARQIMDAVNEYDRRHKHGEDKKAVSNL